MEHFPLTAAIFEGSLVAVAIVLGWFLGTPPLKTFSADWRGALWGIVAAMPPLALFWVCLRCPWRPLKRIAQIIDEILVPLFRDCRAMELAAIAALAGLGEEMLFRGVVQMAVAEKVGGPYGPWLGLAVSAVLFGLLHSVTPTYAMLAGLIGLYLGWIWLVSQNLLVPVVAHGAYDFLVLWYFVRGRRVGNR
jgi:uncharacterized protein